MVWRTSPNETYNTYVLEIAHDRCTISTENATRTTEAGRERTGGLQGLKARTWGLRLPRYLLADRQILYEFAATMSLEHETSTDGVER